jgi:alkylation response protein AidB-like acyl-CoA dehydrogenase
VYETGDLGLLGVAVPEAYGGLGMGFVSTCWFAITFLVQQDLSQLLGAHTESVLCQ